MRTFFSCFLLLSLGLGHAPFLSAQNGDDAILRYTRDMRQFPGYFPYYWDADEGKIYLEIPRLYEEFLYLNSLSAGLGSNDVGLDRGQLGDTRIVKFIRSGPKVLLLQPNYAYRARTDNRDEQRAVEEAFAQSVLASFEIKAEQQGRLLVDLTPFLLRDAHGVIPSLKRSGQGSYSLDLARSTVWLKGCRNFDLNTELDVLLTFAGQPEGSYVRAVTPSPEAVSLRQHHSFTRLPDEGYQPRAFDPRSGFYAISYQDYATPLEAPLSQRFIARHRLEKKDPSAPISEAVEPIVYYLDRGTPEPIRTALLEGAGWWNQAFEAAGYKNAFRVEMLPPGVDPLDIRYNVIQWVHRSTRGWSYGSSVVDPRTGEIIKGHVSLGSLRVRQDYLLAQGLVEAYPEGKEPSPGMKQLALARLRQLSAHEVGHTLGLMHNFAASTNGRTSVMDYPHPLVELTAVGTLDFSQAYDTGIGAWDKAAIRYGYQDFRVGENEPKQLQALLARMGTDSLRYLSDADARPAGSAHPYAHLWDNGENPATELMRLLTLRDTALRRFGLANIPAGSPLTVLEDVLVPLYFSHRYQVEAAAKLIGGVDYRYGVKGGEYAATEPVAQADQTAALIALLQTLRPEVLALPDTLLRLIPPRVPGYPRGREQFRNRTGFTLDPLAAAEAAAEHTLHLLLHPQRAARLVEFAARDPQQLSLAMLLDTLVVATWGQTYADPYQQELARTVQLRVLQHLMQLAASAELPQVQALAWQQLLQLDNWLQQQRPGSPEARAHQNYARRMIARFEREPEAFKPLPAPELPDGSPIGCGY